MGVPRTHALSCALSSVPPPLTNNIKVKLRNEGRHKQTQHTHTHSHTLVRAHTQTLSRPPSSPLTNNTEEGSRYLHAAKFSLRFGARQLELFDDIGHLSPITFQVKNSGLSARSLSVHSSCSFRARAGAFAGGRFVHACVGLYLCRCMRLSLSQVISLPSLRTFSNR